LSILLIDDEPGVDKSLGAFLRARGHTVRFADSPRVALALFRDNSFDVVLSDIRMPGMDGITLLENLRRLDPEIGVILFTGQGDMNSAIRAIRAGASDYLLKPADLQQLLMAIDRTARYHAVRKENAIMEERVEQAESSEETRVFGTHLLIGESAAIRGVRSLAEKFARSPGATALIIGESGTGKELIARFIHRRSVRAGRPFVALNCLALPQQLVESELFGHEKGAFSGADRRKHGLVELADNGTLFLDEIGDMAPDLQGRLLRVLEESKIRRVGGERMVDVDVRFIAATHQNLLERVQSRSFRQDLYYRLQGFMIEIPPLRERRDDIPLIADHYVRHFSSAMRKNVRAIDPVALRRLLAYSFPGNVRELKNMIERAVILAETETLGDEHFPRFESAPESRSELDFSGAEADRIREALANANGNIGEAARRLNVGYGALRYRIRKLGVIPTKR
jgi:DNA-binding NtrC family response regulator